MATVSVKGSIVFVQFIVTENILPLLSLTIIN